MKPRVTGFHPKKSKAHNKKRETAIALNFPKEISIELVQANELRNYEIFMWLVGLVSTIAVGYWTAYFTEGNKSFLGAAIIFTIFSLGFLALAIFKRKKVFNGIIRKAVGMGDFK